MTIKSSEYHAATPVAEIPAVDLSSIVAEWMGWTGDPDYATYANDANLALEALDMWRGMDDTIVRFSTITQGMGSSSATVTLEQTARGRDGPVAPLSQVSSESADTFPLAACRALVLAIRKEG